MLTSAGRHRRPAQQHQLTPTAPRNELAAFAARTSRLRTPASATGEDPLLAPVVSGGVGCGCSSASCSSRLYPVDHLSGSSHLPALGLIIQGLFRNTCGFGSGPPLRPNFRRDSPRPPILGFRGTLPNYRAWVPSCSALRVGPLAHLVRDRAHQPRAPTWARRRPRDPSLVRPSASTCRGMITLTATASGSRPGPRWPACFAAPIYQVNPLRGAGPGIIRVLRRGG